ncbi:hypothetical protein, partial [Bacteroides faecis]|uniref:hypothetical protein n=1 Tax=Bacteroides faecis TaxID=674529 RepID=UPI003D99CB9E
NVSKQLIYSDTKIAALDNNLLVIRKVITTYDNFSVKILPAGLEIFTENRRLDLAFPSNPGITFAPRTKMTD